MSAVMNDMAYAPVEPARTNRLRRLVRQPLLQFLLIGAVIFAASMLLDRSRDSSAHAIIVDAARVQRLAELYRVQMGATPSPAELEYLVDSHIRDEILYREAQKMGLDREDEIIRRRLIQKMEFLQNDLAVVPEPTEEALRLHYMEHPSDFTTHATATFTHIYFSTDAASEQISERAAARQLMTLASGDSVAAAGLGDAFPLQQSYAEIDAQEAAQIFGRTPFVDALFRAPEQRWSGPFRSGYGWHLIFVSKRVASEVMDFKAARERVREAYLAKAKRDANEHSYAALKAPYRIQHTNGGRAE